MHCVKENNESILLIKRVGPAKTTIENIFFFLLQLLKLLTYIQLLKYFYILILKNNLFLDGTAMPKISFVF